MEASLPTLSVESTVVLTVLVLWTVAAVEPNRFPENTERTKLNWILLLSALKRVEVPAAFWIRKAVAELVWFWKRAAPPSAKLNTVVALSLNLAMLPVEVELPATKVSAEPEVRLVTVVGPVIAVVPATDEPMLILVVEEAVALLPMFKVWATAPVVLPT